MVNGGVGMLNQCPLFFSFYFLLVAGPILSKLLERIAYSPCLKLIDKGKPIKKE